MPKKKTQRVSPEVNRAKKNYGMKKIKTGAKLCWVSKQNCHGWSLGLALGKKTIWLRNTRFASLAEVKRALKSGVVFVHLAAEEQKSR